MRDLITRALKVYRSGGLSAFSSAVRAFATSGELRYRLIGLLPGTRTLIRIWINIGRMIRPNHYSDAKPFKIHWVDPQRITRSISGRHHLLRRHGRVFNGEWDLYTDKFDDHRIYRSLFRHFRHGVPWEETEYYENMKAKISRGDHTRAGTSIEEVQAFFAEIDELYHTIANEGYRTQGELLRAAPRKTRLKNMDAPIPEMNEIGICIGRDGSFIYGYRGRHRLTIAKILSLDKVAVHILTRHRQWQRIRDEFRAAGSITEVRPEWRDLRTHPDLQEFIMKDGFE